jgi:transposase-like protein
MRRTGRQPTLTPAAQEAIVQAVTVGLSVVEAAALAGIAKSTVLQWLQRGEGRSRRGTQARYVDFVDAITRARAVDEARRTARINQAAQGGAVVHEKTTTFADGRTVVERTLAPPEWRADAFVLERRYAERWGRKVQADLTLQIQQMVQEVAQELGVDSQLILAEAQSFLREHDRRTR